MKMKRFAGMSAIALAVSLAFNGLARADYNYATQIVVNSVSPGGTFTNTAGGATINFGGTTVTLSNVSRGGFTVPGPNTIDIGDIAVTTSTVAPGSDTFSVNYTDNFTLTNV